MYSLKQRDVSQPVCRVTEPSLRGEHGGLLSWFFCLFVLRLLLLVLLILKAGDMFTINLPDIALCLSLILHWAKLAQKHLFVVVVLL